MLIVKGRGKGCIMRELEAGEHCARKLAAAPDDNTRHALLARPADSSFYAGLPDANVSGKDRGCYFVTSCEHALHINSTASNQHAEGGLSAVDMDFYKLKVGIGPAARRAKYAHPLSPPFWLFLLPSSIPASTREEDKLGRLVLGVEEMLTAVHTPISTRLPGVGMLGEPTSDRRAAMKMAKISTARALGCAVAGMDDAQLELVGAAAQGELLYSSFTLCSPPPGRPLGTPCAPRAGRSRGGARSAL